MTKGWCFMDQATELKSAEASSGGMSKKASSAVVALMALANAGDMNGWIVAGIVTIAVVHIAVQGAIDWKKK